MRSLRWRSIGAKPLYVFRERVPFSSTSTAAAVVFGSNQRGPMVGKTQDRGQTYRDWQAEKPRQAGVGITKC